MKTRPAMIRTGSNTAASALAMNTKNTGNSANKMTAVQNWATHRLGFGNCRTGAARLPVPAPGFVEHLLDSPTGVLMDLPGRFLSGNLYPLPTLPIGSVEQEQEGTDDQTEEAQSSHDGQDGDHDSRRWASVTVCTTARAVMSATACSRLTASGQIAPS